MKHFYRSCFMFTKILLLISLLLTGCAFLNSPGSIDAPALSSTADTILPITLKGYLIGSPPPGLPDVEEELNKKLSKDINAILDINYINWSDLQSKYPLVLASDDDIDWIFTAGWCFYPIMAAKGAFMEITDDMLRERMPLHYTALTHTTAMDDVRINGDLFMIPTSTPDRKVNVVLYREDLRKKYNVPEFKSFSEIEPYLEVVKMNEKAMIPINMDYTYDVSRPFETLCSDRGDYFISFTIASQVNSGIVFNFEDPEGRLYTVLDEPYYSMGKEAAYITKQWYDKGYINSNVFSNDIRSKELFTQGKSAVAFGNSIDIQSCILNAEEKGWEIGIIPVVSSKSGHAPNDSSQVSGIGIPTRSKNASLVMMAFDRIMEDEAYDTLAYFGIEGKNYVVEDGKVALPDGITTIENSYPPDASGFWFTNKDILMPLKMENAHYLELKKKIKRGMLVNSVYGGFIPVSDNIKTELTNLNKVMLQYFNPIAFGKVKDVEAAFAELNKQMKIAGIDKVMEQMRSQTESYLKQRK